MQMKKNENVLSEKWDLSCLFLESLNFFLTARSFISKIYKFKFINEPLIKMEGDIYFMNENISKMDISRNRLSFENYCFPYIVIITQPQVSYHR